MTRCPINCSLEEACCLHIPIRYLALFGRFCCLLDSSCGSSSSSGYLSTTSGAGTVGGVVKALWFVFIVFVPVIGVIAYLIARPPAADLVAVR